MTATTAAAVKSAAPVIAAAGAAAYVPGEWVLMCCLIGAAFSVWAQAARVELSPRALIGLLGQYGACVSFGYFGVVFAHYLLPVANVAIVQAIADVPDYAQAGALAGFSQYLMTLLRRKADAA